MLSIEKLTYRIGPRVLLDQADAAGNRRSLYTIVRRSQPITRS